MKQRFQIGDSVEVSSTCRFHGEWNGQPLWVVAVQCSDRLHAPPLRLLYSTSEFWPSQPGWTTDWDETDLSPRALIDDGSKHAEGK